jgi:hypothetical protein
MANDFLKRTRTLCENGYGVRASLDGLVDVFGAYDHNERSRILNDLDKDDSFDGDNPRETAENMALSLKLHARHALLTKANR